MNFWKRQNYGDSKKIDDYHSLGVERGMNKQNTGDF